MAGRPKSVVSSDQSSLMAGLKKPVEYENEDFVFTMCHHVGGKKLLIKDCNSDDEILIPGKYLYFLKQVVDAEMKSIQQIAPRKEELAESKREPIPSLDDEPETETPEEIIARLEQAKAVPKATAAKKS